MITITNGRLTLQVTPGAYKDIYAAQGYTLISETPVEETGVLLDTPLPSGDKLLSEDPSDTTASVFNQETDDPKPEEDNSEEDLSEIPLNEMTDKQLKAYAQQLGVDLKGITSRKAVRDKIRSAL